MTSLKHIAAAALGALVLGTFAGCADTDSATDLNPDGPPMIEQVRLLDASRNQRVFGFGTHPDAQPTDEPDKATITVAATSQFMRIIIDELLIGNYLENISCTTSVEEDGSSFQFVPVGATPDDIARCALASDVLPETCTGPHAVCICHRTEGCGAIVGGQPTFANGVPVGVLDTNLDGAADLHQFRADAVGISCGDDLSIHVPIDLDKSYWNPSGNQQPPAVPSGSPFDELGPAIVLYPRGPLPANLGCQLVFSDDVTDKQNINVCAPPDGDVTKDCTPGDTSAFRMQMETLSIQLVNPIAGGTLNRTDDIIVSTNDTIPLDPASLGGIQLLENGVPYTQITITLDMSGSNITIHSTAAGGFDPNATYTIIVPTTVTDTFGQPIVQALMATFMTGA